MASVEHRTFNIQRSTSKKAEFNYCVGRHVQFEHGTFNAQHPRFNFKLQAALNVGMELRFRNGSGFCIVNYAKGSGVQTQLFADQAAKRISDLHMSRNGGRPTILWITEKIVARTMPL